MAVVPLVRMRPSGLKRGGTVGPGRPKLTPEDREVKRICKKLILRKSYQKILQEKLDDCTLHPSVQVMLWYYAMGKPRELIETVQVTPVRIEHLYADVTKPAGPVVEAEEVHGESS